VGILNSDDVYAPDAFTTVAQAFATSTAEMVMGGAEIFMMTNGQERVLHQFVTPRAIGLSEANAIGNVTLINSCFWRRSLLLRMAPFDDRFRVAADKDFWMRLVIMQPDHVLLPRLLYRYLSHSGSLTFSGADTRERGAVDLLVLARTRFVECYPGTPEHAAYRRWHAWAVGYFILIHLLKRHPRSAMRAACDGWALDAAWPLRFLWRLPSHWRDRKIRRGEL
jgi:hypothetical protein